MAKREAGAGTSGKGKGKGEARAGAPSEEAPYHGDLPEALGLLVVIHLSGQEEPARFVVDEEVWEGLARAFRARRGAAQGRLCFDTVDLRRVVVDPAEVDRAHFLFEVVSAANLPALFQEAGSEDDDDSGSAIAAWFRGGKGPDWIEGDIDTDMVGLARAALSGRRAFAGSTDSDDEPFYLNLSNLQLLDVPLAPCRGS